MLQSESPALILASASSARRAVLEAAGLVFETRPAAIDEDSIKASARTENLSADEAALLLAEMKAQRVARNAGDALVIGCDQILVCDGRWFDKPRDVAEARRHLQELRGQRHHLATAVTCLRNGQIIWRHVSRPELTMRRFSDPFLEAYLLAEAGHVTKSAGGYRLEGLGVHLFDRIDGEHSAILGLPLLSLLGFLRQHGIVTD